MGKSAGARLDQWPAGRRIDTPCLGDTREWDDILPLAHLVAKCVHSVRYLRVPLDGGLRHHVS